MCLVWRARWQLPPGARCSFFFPATLLLSEKFQIKLLSFNCAWFCAGSNTLHLLPDLYPCHFTAWLKRLYFWSKIVCYYGAKFCDSLPSKYIYDKMCGWVEIHQRGHTWGLGGVELVLWKEQMSWTQNWSLNMRKSQIEMVVWNNYSSAFITNSPEL